MDLGSSEGMKLYDKMTRNYKTKCVGTRKILTRHEKKKGSMKICWNRLPKEAVESPPLEMLET